MKQRGREQLSLLFGECCKGNQAMRCASGAFESMRDVESAGVKSSKWLAGEWKVLTSSCDERHANAESACCYDSNMEADGGRNCPLAHARRANDKNPRCSFWTKA